MYIYIDAVHPPHPAPVNLLPRAPLLKQVAVKIFIYSEEH